MAAMREELLHHIWKFRLFGNKGLTTTDGRTVEVVRPGEHSADAGPDFINARIRIEDVLLAGNVELHVKASDWLLHGHQHDPAYANIILHVVFENDLSEPLGDFSTLELHHRISDQVLKRYSGLVHAMQPIACGKSITEVEHPVLHNWLERVLLQRLQRKSEWMAEIVEQCAGDLEQAFFIIMARTMGMKVNGDAFEIMARRLPWKALMKHRDSPMQLEALLFGTAGLLHGAGEDDYPQLLRKEFDFLRHKYGLDPMSGTEWRYLRLRPANFPTIRLAQLAGMINCCGPLLHWYSAHFTKDDCPSVLARPSAYWDTHYTFGQPGKFQRKPLGATMQRHMLINAVAPYLMVLADREHREELRGRALEMLYSIEGEKNSRIHPFRELGLKIPNAATAQALLELRSHWCDHRKCLNCAIGNQVLKRE
jgi:hypothetical protein